MLKIFCKKDNVQKSVCFSKKREDNVQKKHKNVSYPTKNNSKDVCFLSKHFEAGRDVQFEIYIEFKLPDLYIELEYIDNDLLDFYQNSFDNSFQIKNIYILKQPPFLKKAYFQKERNI